MPDNQEFDQSENPYAAPDYSPADLSPTLKPQNSFEAELQAFVGSKADYYLERWSAILYSAGNGAGFNWAAFFIAPLWIAYRKMYLVLLLFWSLICIEVMLEDMIFINILEHAEVPRLVDRGSGLLIAVICGLFANRLYLWHAKKKIAEAQSEGHEGEQLLWQISKRGGTSLLASFGLNFLAFVSCVVFWVVYEILVYGL